MDTVIAPHATEATDWVHLAARARYRRRAATGLLYGFLVLGSLPIVIPYLWLFTVALSGRAGASTVVLWRSLAILLPALLVWSMLRVGIDEERRLRRCEVVLLSATLIALAFLIGPYLHTGNWRFLWNA